MPQHLHCSSQLQLLWSSINATSSDAAAFMAPNLSSIYRAAFKLQWCHHSSSAAYIQHFSHNSIYSAPLTQQHFGLSIHDVDLTLHHFRLCSSTFTLQIKSSSIPPKGLFNCRVKKRDLLWDSGKKETKSVQKDISSGKAHQKWT